MLLTSAARACPPPESPDEARFGGPPAFRYRKQGRHRLACAPHESRHLSDFLTADPRALLQAIEIPANFISGAQIASQLATIWLEAGNEMKLKRMFTLAVASAGVAFGVNTAQAAVIIDASTQAYYNAGLGDLAPALGTQTSVGGFSLFPAANVSAGDPTIPPIATAPDVSSVTNLGTWLTNAAPTGGTWSAGQVPIPATWAINSETAIVYAINAGSGLSNVHIDFGVDNGIYVWLNGTYIFGAMAPGGAAITEYDIDIASLGAGMHYLQILREDHGGQTGYAIQMTADRSQVPAPGALALLGIGIAGLGVSRRRVR